MLIMPTRGRPDNFARFVKAYKDTGAIDKVVVKLDLDDPTALQYNQVGAPPHWEFIVSEPSKGCFAQNIIFQLYPNQEYYGIIADDLVPRTRNWDQILAAACGSWGVSYGDDLLKRETLATHPFIGG